MKATCGGCDTTWTGLNMAHCATCHETFSIIKHFDAHRVRGHCVDPAKLKHTRGKRKGQPLLKQNENGVWVGADVHPMDVAA